MSGFSGSGVDGILAYKQNVTIYKYLSAEQAAQVLDKRTFRWSTPDTFVDPFECQFEQLERFSIDEAVETYLRKVQMMVMDPNFDNGSVTPVLAQMVQQMKSAPGPARKGMLNKLKSTLNASYRKLGDASINISRECKGYIKRIAVFDAYGVYDNMLMWRDYADNHRGVVIKIRTFTHDKPNEFSCIKPVQYRQAVPVVIGQELLDPGSEAPLPSSEEVFDRIIYTKAPYFTYEREFRALTRMKEKEHADIPFDPSAIDTIYLGCDMVEAERHNFERLVKAHMPHVGIVALGRHEDEFRFTYEKVKDSIMPAKVGEGTAASFTQSPEVAKAAQEAAEILGVAPSENETQEEEGATSEGDAPEGEVDTPDAMELTEAAEATECSSDDDSVKKNPDVIDEPSDEEKRKAERAARKQGYEAARDQAEKAAEKASEASSEWAGIDERLFHKKP